MDANLVIQRERLFIDKISDQYQYDNNIRHFMDNSPIDEIMLIDNYFLLRNGYNYSFYSIVDNYEELIDSFYYDLSSNMEAVKKN